MAPIAQRYKFIYCILSAKLCVPESAYAASDDVFFFQLSASVVCRILFDINSYMVLVVFSPKHTFQWYTFK